jgi:hypothetical protein
MQLYSWFRGFDGNDVVVRKLFLPALPISPRDRLTCTARPLQARLVSWLRAHPIIPTIRRSVLLLPSILCATLLSIMKQSGRENREFRVILSLSARRTVWALRPLRELSGGSNPIFPLFYMFTTSVPELISLLDSRVGISKRCLTQIIFPYVAIEDVQQL